MFYLRTSVGVEIRQDDLLLTSLQSNLAAGVFTHFKRVTGFRSRDKAEVRREIDAFFKSAKLSRETIVLGIPRSDVIVRHLDLPIEVGDNLKQVIQYQVQAFEPTEEEKFYHDYLVLGSKEGAKRLVVLVVMVRRSVLDAHLAFLRELGIRPVMVTMSSAALSSAFLKAGKGWEKKTFILMDLAASGVEVVALRDGSLVYSHAAVRNREVSWKELLLAEIDTALARIRLGPEDSVEKIILSGEAAEAARRELGDEMADWDVMANYVRFEMPVTNQPHLLEGAAALGLAFAGLVRRSAIRLNLLPQELRIRQSRWAYVPAVILGLALAGLLVALGSHRLVQERILIRQLDQEIAVLQPRVNKVQAVRAEGDAIEKRIVYLEGLLCQRDMNLEVLQELTSLLPQDTFLNFYTNREGTIQISGSSTTAPDLIPKLEKSPLLQNVIQRGTVFKDAQTGKDRFNFEAKLERLPCSSVRAKSGS